MSDPAPWRRQSSQQAGESLSPDVTDSSNGHPPPPPPPFGAPPPPPPPGLAGSIPSMRISSEIESRGRSPKPTAPGEPPAAIQNAMMTKDKKPFTYTPGGLDLSQIRSPRIQRRINRNMADEGVAPLPPQQEHGPLPPAAQAAMQPNLPVQVLPPPPPPPPSGGLGAGPTQSRFPAAPQPPPPSFAPPLGGAQASVSAQAVQQTAANLRPTGIAPLRRDPQAEPGSLYIAPVAAQPSPAAPSVSRAQLGSLYIPPVADMTDSTSPSPPPPPQRQHFSPQSPQATLNKAPTPWMSSNYQQQQQQQQQPQYMQQVRQPPSPAAAQPGARIIPIQIEGREPPQPASPHSGAHTPLTPQEAHLSQWQREQQLRQQQRQQQPQQAPWRTVQPPSPSMQPGERVIPIQFESPSSSNGTTSPPVRQPLPPQQQYQQQQHQHPQQQHMQQQRRPMAPVGAPQQYNSGPEWGASPPVQSQSFRVLQKITGTDRDDDRDGSVPRDQQPGRMNEMNAAQLRKLQLNDEDRALMNRFKAQVDDEVYLHQEADPRYRGAAIPSRAFRMLQNMTGEDDGSAPMPSRISPAVRAAQQAVQESASQPYVPPSEQTVAEPRKYTGSAIPSRSFRMLQAMTAGSENCAANASATPQSEPSSDAYGAEFDPSLPPYPYPPTDGQWTDSQPPTEEQQRQFWEHYNAMCAYMTQMNAALGYPPYGYAYDPYWGAAPHAAYHSDSEDCSGYSSTDEMTYYGARFAAHQLHDPSWYGYAWPAAPATPGTPSITVTTPTNEVADEAPPSAAPAAPVLQLSRTILTDVEELSDEDDDEESSDTEVEDGGSDASPLRSARSVTNVQVYSDSGDAGNEASDDEEEEEEDDVDNVVIPATEQYPHQLSVIPEESDASDADSVRRRQRELSTSTMTAPSDDDATEDDLGDDDDDDAESTTVTVRLPLKLHFTRSENDEEVTTVTVGEVRRSSTSSNDSSASSPRSEKQRPTFPTAAAVPRRASADASSTATSPSTPPSATSTASSDVSVVFPFRARRPSTASGAPFSPVCTSSTEEDDRARSNEESDGHWEDDSSSTSIQTVRRHDQHSGSEVSDGHWEDDSSSTSIQTVKVNDDQAQQDDGEDDVEEDFEWGEDGTLQTVVRRRSSAFETDEKDVVPPQQEEEEEEEEEAEEEEEVMAPPADEDTEDDDISCSSESSSSTTSSSSSSTSSSSSRSDSSRASSAVVCSKSSCVHTGSGSSLHSSARGSAEAIVPVVAVTVDASENATEDEDDEEDELESDSRPEDVEECVRGLIAHLSASPSGHLLVPPKPAARDDDAAPVVPDDKAERSEEEDDSGVTSDMSRHISEAENEEAAETRRPRKISKYQRAQTHSRLFRLLQDESLNTAAAEEPPHPELGMLASRKECLTLPLSAPLRDPDSVSLSSSSGITSPSSPTVTDRLVRDLVQTLLQRKKGRRLRKVPMAKLQAAALRILQEDMDPYDTSTSEEGGLLPCQRVPPAHGAYGQEYTSYYETWGQCEADDLADYDIMPSRAFRLFDQHARPSGFSPGVIEGLRAKCPRVRSGKDLHKALQLLDVDCLPTPPPSADPDDPNPPRNGLGTTASGSDGI